MDIEKERAMRAARKGMVLYSRSKLIRVNSISDDQISYIFYISKTGIYNYK